MGGSKGAKELERALRAGEPVGVRRAIRGTARLDGYVVGVGRKWALLHIVCDQIRLDGYSAVRIRDVEHVTSSGWPGADFVHRALSSRGDRPAPLPDVDLDSTARLIETMAEAFPMLGLTFEEIDPDALFIGRARGITSKKRVRLQQISSRAVWDTSYTMCGIRDITRFDAGDGYMEALHLVGGDPPGS
ncbi:hypothetical protein [Planomonospora parontospora]|uniref:hypothetical protein n=1 Tax=Planomonospora parontospora TaxID=58119 RepID=UPI0016716D21|nr:hypothetical protein [Planomonospora parontospora]